MTYLKHLVAVLFLYHTLFGQSYEGDIGFFPVWLDLKPSVKDDSLYGSYFYKRVGTPIQLKGKRIGQQLILSEYSKKGVVTGVWTCNLYRDTILGKWGKNNSDSVHQVSLQKTDPAYRVGAKNQSKFIFGKNGTLQDEIDSYSDSESGYTEPASFSYEYNKKNILSVGVTWSFMGAYPNFGTNYHCFDLTTGSEISVWDEVDEKSVKNLEAWLLPQINDFLLSFRKEQTDSTWKDILPFFNMEWSGNDTVKLLEKIFSVADTARALERLNCCYIGSDGIHFTDAGHGYFGFPHVIEALDSKLDITMSFEEFDQYLKPNSILRNLAKK